MKKLFTLLLITFTVFSSYAQLNWFAQSGTTTAVVDLNICDDTTYSIYCINPTAGTLTSPSLDIQLPVSVQYIPGSLQLEAGSVVVTEGNIADLSHPVFTVADIPANGVMVFTYRVKALCGGAANSVPVPVTLTYDGNQTSSPNLQGGGLSAVNINSPAINIVAATNQNYTGNVGDTYSQTITLRNAGLGHLRLDRGNGGNFVSILLDSTSCVSISNPSVGTLSGDTLSIPLNAISGLLTGDADQLWENNEDLLITYSVSINCCNGLTRAIQPMWGCDATTCTMGSQFFSNVILNAGVPDLAVTPVFVGRQYPCLNGQDEARQLVIRNTGTQLATNILIRIGNGYGSNNIPANPSYWDSWDTSSIFIYKSWDMSNTQVFPVPGSVHPIVPMSHGMSVACAPANSVKAYDLSLPDIAPGDSVIISFNVSSSDACCNFAANPLWSIQKGLVYLNSGEGYKLTYKNTCADADYTSGNVHYRTVQNMLHDYEIVAPTDVLGGQPYNFKIVTAAFSMFSGSNPLASGYTLRLELPVGMSFINPSVSFQNGNNNTITSTSITNVGGNIYDIRFPRGNINSSALAFSNSDIIIPMSTACPGGEKQITSTWFADFDTTCNASCPVPVSREVTTVVVHCPPCDTNGIANIGMELKRTTLGFPDNDRDNIPDAGGSLDFTKINLHRIMPGDTLSSTVRGIVINNVANYGTPNNLYLDLTFPNAADMALFTQLPGMLTVYRGGLLLFSCNNISGTASGNKMSYDLNACISGNSYQFIHGDSMIFTNNLRYTYPFQNAVDRKIIINSLFYATDAPMPTSPLLKCDAYSDYCNIVSGFTWNCCPGIHTPSNNCQILAPAIRFSHFFGNLDGIGYNTLFPYENRPFHHQDSITITIPEGYELAQYDFGAGLKWNHFYVQYGARTLNPLNASAPTDHYYDIPYTINGNKVTFYPGQLYTDQGGTLIGKSEAYYSNIQWFIKPTCEVPNLSSLRDTIISSTIYQPNLGTPLNTALNSVNVPWNTYTVKQPIMTLSGGGINTTSSSHQDWDFVLSNLSISANGGNNWLLPVVKQGNGVIDSIVYNGSLVSKNAAGYYMLGNIPANQSNNYKVYVHSSSCDTFQFAMYTGWTCNAYPISLADSNHCGSHTLFTSVPLPAGTDANLTVINNNGNTSNFCTPVEVEMVLNSTQLGDISNLTLDYILPFGFSYVPNSAMIQYPINTPYRVPSNPAAVTFNQAIMNIDVNNIDTTLGNGLTGSYDADLKTMKIKMQLMTQCGAASGDVLTAVYNSLSACGEVLPVIVKESNPIIFTEAAVPGYTTSPLAIADTIEGCNAATLYDLDVYIDINQITGPSQAGDSIFVTLPPGVVFNNYDMNAAGQANQPMITMPSGPVDVGNGQMRYGWPMTGGLSSGTIHFRFQYTFDYAQYTSCSQLLKSFIVTTGGNSQVTCNGETCNLFSINGRGEASMDVKMPALQGSIQTANCTYFPASGNTISNPLDILIMNTGTADIASGTLTRVDIYCDADSNGVINAGDNVLQQATTTQAIPAGGSVSINNVTISYSDFTCLSKKVLVNISRVPAVGAEQCICEQPATSFVCIETPLPVTLTSFTGIPQEVSNRLEWSVSKELNFSHYELERSTGTQTNFKRIASIEGRNALVSTSYHYDDLKPSLHEYYRLKMVDLDGKFAYSETVYLNREHITSDNIYVYPNPVTNTLNLAYYGTVSEETLELNIVDMVGKLIMSKNVNVIKGINTLQLDTEDLASGNYILRIKRSERDMDEFIRFSK